MYEDVNGDGKLTQDDMVIWALMIRNSLIPLILVLSGKVSISRLFFRV